MAAMTRSLSRLYLVGGQHALFPPVCTFCDRLMQHQLPAYALCRDCRLQLSTDLAELCPTCGVKVNRLVQRADGCPYCRRSHLRFSTTITLGPYEGALRTAIVRMKRSSEQCLTHAMGCLLAERTKATAVPFDLVVPAPTHWTRRLVRGVPSAARLAQSLAEVCKIPFCPGLVRQQRRTRKQSLLEPAERRRNLAGAYKVRKHVSLSGQVVAAVDDTMTTGTTMNEMARCLRRAGAAQVIAVVAARAHRR